MAQTVLKIKLSILSSDCHFLSLFLKLNSRLRSRETTAINMAADSVVRNGSQQTSGH